MKNNFFNNPVANIYSKPALNSEITSQILYGEKFKILSSKKSWVKIKTSYDNYSGYIKKDKFYMNLRPTSKISKIKSKIFIKKDSKFLPTRKFLYFGSGIVERKKTKKYIEFENNKWIQKNDIKDFYHYEKNYVKIFKLFLKTKYLWGGKTCDGIDCSALIQIYFYYNRIFFPRDTKDQIRYCQNKNVRKLLKGDIVFWEGHVGICVDRSNFIHAYGPKRKVILMSTNATIDIVKKTANLKIKKISNIKKY